MDAPAAARAVPPRSSPRRPAGSGISAPRGPAPARQSRTARARPPPPWTLDDGTRQERRSRHAGLARERSRRRPAAGNRPCWHWHVVSGWPTPRSAATTQVSSPSSPRQPRAASCPSPRGQPLPAAPAGQHAAAQRQPSSYATTSTSPPPSSSGSPWTPAAPPAARRRDKDDQDRRSADPRLAARPAGDLSATLMRRLVPNARAALSSAADPDMAASAIVCASADYPRDADSPRLPDVPPSTSSRIRPPVRPPFIAHTDIRTYNRP